MTARTAGAGADRQAPFGAGSVSFRLYPHQLDAPAMAHELCSQAALATAAGFDGVMISERHGGIAGNMPNPVQVAGWLLDAMTGGWVAPCPVLTPLHPAAQIVEDIAWLAARHPGRVGVGLATGGHELDYAMYGLDRADLAARFGASLAAVTANLSGRGTTELAGDAAVRRCAEHPVPVVSAALSATAARRAAACGAGIVGSSLLRAEDERRLTDAYLAAGGTGPRVLIRHVWVGEPPRQAIAAKLDDYRTSGAGEGRRFESDEVVASTDGDAIAERVHEVLQSSGKTCVNLRVHVPGIAPADAREQIAAVAETVLPGLRQRMAAGATR